MAQQQTLHSRHTETNPKMSVTSVKSGATGISTALDNNYMEPIATQLVGVGGSAALTFSNIPQGYKHLQIRGIGRSNRVDNWEYVQMQFNGDTGTNYTRHFLDGDGTGGGAGAYGNGAMSSVLMIYGAGNSQAANAYGGFVIDILDYSDSTKKKVVKSHLGTDDNSAGHISFNSALWNSTAPITSLKFFMITNMLQNTRVSLYGIRG